MPRNSVGNYSLPSGNPVVSGEVISTTWANPTLADIAGEMTNSLDRNGRGGMLAPFKFLDGAAGAPGITWATEPTMGIYRAGAQDMRATVAGISRMRWTATGVDVWDTTAGGGAGGWVTMVGATGMAFLPLTGGAITGNLTVSGALDVAGAISEGGTSLSAKYAKLTANVFTATQRIVSSVPSLQISESDQAIDEKEWAWYVNSKSLHLRLWDDAFSTNKSAIQFVRGTGVAVGSINYGNATDLPQHSFFGPTSFNNAVVVNFGTNSSGLVTQGTNDGIFWIKELDGPADEKMWRFWAGGGDLTFQAYDDALGSGANWLQVKRTGITIDSTQFVVGASGTLKVTVGVNDVLQVSNDVIVRDKSTTNQYRVGYRSAPVSGTAGNIVYSAVPMNGTVQVFTGAGGFSFTTAAPESDGDIVTVVNMGSAALSLVCGGVLRWFTGATFTDGSPRTLAVGGVATFAALSGAGTNNWMLWGSGIT